MMYVHNGKAIDPDARHYDPFSKILAKHYIEDHRHHFTPTVYMPYNWVWRKQTLTYYLCYHSIPFTTFKGEVLWSVPLHEAQRLVDDVVTAHWKEHQPWASPPLSLPTP